MRLLQMLLNPAIIGLLALVLSVIWMVRDERDKTRPMLVLALTLNLFYGFLLTVFMSREGSLFPMKYDPVLYRLDTALGVSAAAVAIPLQGAWRLPLVVVYNSMIPMMICWFLVTRYRNIRGAVVLAYVAELISGPMMYAILPACGPIYAFGAQWLHPPTVTTTTTDYSDILNPGTCNTLTIGGGLLSTLTVFNANLESTGLNQTNWLITAPSATGTQDVIRCGGTAQQGSTGGSVCEATYPTGTTVTLTAPAETGVNFGGWSSNCTAQGVVTAVGPNSCTVVVGGGCTLNPNTGTYTCTDSTNVSVGAIFN